ncbi:hypothetical protein VP01_7688g1 [Puccinia sorghi]|uniref:Uncharacterized protein n=1 Tax=Puccinia sorghi TaxID=27349 RepID=A0A0L6UBM8_9BASI|nr:hypothetical protein VP01_7688g1 [Puccinia sorghi]
MGAFIWSSGFERWQRWGPFYFVLRWQGFWGWRGLGVFIFPWHGGGVSEEISGKNEGDGKGAVPVERLGCSGSSTLGQKLIPQGDQFFFLLQIALTLGSIEALRSLTSYAEGTLKSVMGFDQALGPEIRPFPCIDNLDMEERLHIS